MQLTYLPLGGAQEVGASCGLLTIGETRLLIDAGLRPGAAPGAPRTPDLHRLPAPPDAILVTHAHIDHTGALPLVAALYPQIPIYATESTIALMRVLLLDSVRVMEAEHLRQEGETPLYDLAQVEALLARITPIAFEQVFQPLAAQPTITARFLRAGHILGAGMLVLDTPAGRVLHTGDFSVTDQRTIKSVDLQRLPETVDLLICEGTYGNRAHSARREEERRLVETVQGIVGAGGRVLFPAFGVGRAQELVLILKAFRANGEIPPVPIYIDGMCRAVCDTYQAQVHDLHPKLHNQLRNGRRPLFADPSLRVFAMRQGERDMLLTGHTAAIIVSSSGMLSGGPAPLYARALAAYAQDAICFTGYQDEESPGAALLRTKQGDTVTLNGERVTLACQVTRYNLSVHADAEQIVHLITKVRPRQVVLIHGEPTALHALAERLRGYRVAIPACGETATVRAARHALPTESRPTPAPVGVPAPVPMVDSPTPATLYAAVQATGAAPRPWTAVEIGQRYYGAAYTPALRPLVEQTLVGAERYFRPQRLGAQMTYLPRSAEEVAQRTALVATLATLQPGAIVLVQAANGQGEPRLAIVVAPVGNVVELIADGWKGTTHPLTVVQLVPWIDHPDLLSLEPSEIKARLRQWREQLATEAVDPVALWDASDGQAHTLAELATRGATAEVRLALGLALLRYGHMLWQCAGGVWTPRDRATVLARNPGFAHHLQMVHAVGQRVTDPGDNAGTLTGRSRWGAVEVAWDTGTTDWRTSHRLTLGTGVQDALAAAAPD
ncbi:MAG TPA: MBL fold metallo-hydrolase [Herpetosiphonaceae bacterium]